MAKGTLSMRAKRLCQERLAATGGTEEQDVRLGQLDAVLGGGRTGLHPLVMVVDGDREDLLCVLLADDVVIEELEDLPRLGEVLEGQLGGVFALLGDDVVTQVDALVADVHAGAGDEFLDLLLRLAAEAALDQVPALSELRHQFATPVPCPNMSDLLVPYPLVPAPLRVPCDPSAYAAPMASSGATVRAVMTSSITP